MQTSFKHTGNFVYENNQLAYILTPEGRALPDGNGGFQYQYYLKDHPGNTRIMFDENKTVLQNYSYYPFGMEQNGFNYTNTSTLKNNYLYNGKELQDDFGLEWYDYGARFYDAELGRWFRIDGKAEKYYARTPYTYSLNNPIRFVDPDGNDGWDVVVGTAIGIVTNIVPGSTSLRNSYTPTDAADYNNALRSTDAAAMAVGEGMVIGGGGVAVGGLAVAGVAGTASLAVVDAPVTVPVAAGALAVAEKGAEVATVGALLMANGAANAAAGYNYGEEGETSNKASDNSKNKKHSDKNALSKSEQQIKDYKQQIEGATKKEKAKLKTKIKNVRETAQKNAKGVEHSKTKKR